MMDKFRYTHILHDFLKKHGIAKYIVGRYGSLRSELIKCHDLIEEVNKMVTYRHETAPSNITSGNYDWYDAHKNTKPKKVAARPEDILYLIITYSSIAPRLNGIGVDWLSINNEWERLVKTNNKESPFIPKKQEFKSIW